MDDLETPEAGDDIWSHDQLWSQGNWSRRASDTQRYGPGSLPELPAMAKLHPRGHSSGHLNSVEIGPPRAFAAFERRVHTLPREKDLALFRGNDAVSMPREMASGDAC